MGEYIIYYRGKVVGGIYDDRFLVKNTKAAVKLMPEAVLELPAEQGLHVLGHGRVIVLAGQHGQIGVSIEQALGDTGLDDLHLHEGIGHEDVAASGLLLRSAGTVLLQASFPQLGIVVVAPALGIADTLSDFIKVFRVFHGASVSNRSRCRCRRGKRDWYL